MVASQPTERKKTDKLYLVRELQYLTCFSYELINFLLRSLPHYLQISEPAGLNTRKQTWDRKGQMSTFTTSVHPTLPSFYGTLQTSDI